MADLSAPLLGPSQHSGSSVPQSSYGASGSAEKYTERDTGGKGDTAISIRGATSAGPKGAEYAAPEQDPQLADRLQACPSLISVLSKDCPERSMRSLCVAAAKAEEEVVEERKNERKDAPRAPDKLEIDCGLASPGYVQAHLELVRRGLVPKHEQGLAGELGDAEVEETKVAWLLHKFEIARDFFQILSLLTFLYPENFGKSVGNVSNSVAIDFHSIAEKYNVHVSSTTIFVVLGLASWASLAFFEKRKRADPDMLRDGFEVRTWGRRSVWELRISKLLVTLLTTLYLPVSQNAIRVFVWDSSFWPEGTVSVHEVQCWDSSLLIFLAVAMLLSVSLYLPYSLLCLIQRSLPEAQAFDATGESIVFSDEDWGASISKDKSPYRFMYEAYKREWSTYTVWMMLFKLGLVIAVTVPGSSNCAFESSSAEALARGRGVVMTLILCTVAFLGYRASPFLDDMDSLQDSSGNITSGVTAFLGTLAAFNTDNSTVFGVVMIVVNVGNICVMIAPYLSQSDWIQHYFKFRKRELSFSEDNNGEPLVFSEGLDVAGRIKSRVWKTFWDGLLLSHPALRPPPGCELTYSEGSGKNPYVYLLDFKGSVAERHLENKRLLATLGRNAYAAALDRLAAIANDPSLSAALQDILEHFSGMDSCAHGRFGKAFVVPFPFSIVMAFDGGGDLVLSHDADLIGFAQENSSESVQMQRKLRHQMRALAGQMVFFLHQETKRKSKQRWVERTQWNSQTQQNEVRRVQETYHVDVNFTFRHGMLFVGQEKDVSWVSPRGVRLNTSPGFAPGIHYNDGEGVDREGKRWTNEPTTIGAFNMGWTVPHQMTSDLQRLLHNPRNAEIVHAHMSGVVSLQRDHRIYYAQQTSHKRAVLDYDFALRVFDNDALTREELHQYLSARKTAMDKVAPHVWDYIFSKMGLLRQRLNGYWFVVWEDIWNCNQDVLCPRAGEVRSFFNKRRAGKVKKAAASAPPAPGAAVPVESMSASQLSEALGCSFDPASATALCYAPRSQAELLRFLGDHGLYQDGVQGFFDGRFLRRFNAAMAKQID